jgi:hypothetical protein
MGSGLHNFRKTKHKKAESNERHLNAKDKWRPNFEYFSNPVCCKVFVQLVKLWPNNVLKKKVWLVQPTSFIIIHYASLRSLEMQYMPLITFDNLAQKNVSWLTSFRLTKTKIILFQRDERETDFVDLDEEEVLSHLSWSFSFDK